MSNTTEKDTDARRKAAKTPLTEEAVTHLRAAAAEADDRSNGIRAILELLEDKIDDKGIGTSVTLSDSEKVDVVESLRAISRMVEHDLLRPIYARARGDRPHGKNAHPASGVVETVEIPFDLLITVRALAEYAAAGADCHEAHEIRDALAELHGDLDRIERQAVEASGMELDSVTDHAGNLVTHLMERAGHG